MRININQHPSGHNIVEMRDRQFSGDADHSVKFRTPNVVVLDMQELAQPILLVQENGRCAEDLEIWVDPRTNECWLRRKQISFEARKKKLEHIPFSELRKIAESYGVPKHMMYRQGMVDVIMESDFPEEARQPETVQHDAPIPYRVKGGRTEL